MSLQFACISACIQNLSTNPELHGVNCITALNEPGNYIRTYLPVMVDLLSTPSCINVEGWRRNALSRAVGKIIEGYLGSVDLDPPREESSYCHLLCFIR